MEPGIQLFPESASTFAGSVDWLFAYLMTVSIFFCLLTLVMFFWGAKIYIAERQPPDQSMEVYVVAKQWMWKLQHAEGRKEINELHVPVNRPVKLVMASED